MLIGGMLAAPIIVGATPAAAVGYGTLSGVVTDAVSGLGIPDVTVRLTTLAGSTVTQVATVVASGPYVAGYYEFATLAEGTYLLQFLPTSNHVSEWWDNATSIATATAVTVVAATTITKNPVLARGGYLSGTIKNPGGGNQVGASVTAYLGQEADPAATDTVGSDGTYELSQLAPGNYRLFFSGGTGTANLWYPNSVSKAFSTPIAVTNGSSNSSANIVLPYRVFMFGELQNAQLNPLSGIVVFYDAQATTISAGAVVATATVSSNGDIAVPGLAPGNYKIGYSTNAAGFTIYNGLLPSSDPYLSEFYSSTGGAYSIATAGTYTISTTPSIIYNVNATLLNPRFADASDPTSAFFTYIQWMGDTGISVGTVQPSGKPLYKPLAVVSRQAFAQFFYRLAGAGFMAPATASFADVPTSAPAFAAVEWMVAEGISTGTLNPAGGLPLFKPLDPVSRQSMALFLARAARVNTTTPPLTQSFADVPVTAPQAAAIKFMADYGVSTGTAQPTGLPLFKPLDPVSRQAMAAFLFRYSNLGSG